MAGIKSGQCKIINAACSFGSVCDSELSFCPRMESHLKEFCYSKTMGVKWQGQNQKTHSFSKLLASLNLNGIGLLNGTLDQSPISFLHSSNVPYVFGLLALSNFAKFGSQIVHFHRSIFKGRLVIPSFCFIIATSPSFLTPVLGGAK